MKQYDKLIFELSKSGRRGYSLPQSSHTEYSLEELPSFARRSEEPLLPEVSEFDVVRHFTNLSNKNFGLDTGFYPLGSCTMKYNPKINEDMSNLEGFTAIHPLQPAESMQGAPELYYLSLIHI